MGAQNEQLELSQDFFGGDDDWNDVDSLESEDRGDSFVADEAEAPSAVAETAETAEEPEQAEETKDEVDEVEEPTEEAEEPEIEAEAPEVAEPETKNDTRIPRSRLNKEIQKRRALEEQLKELQAKAPEAQPAQEPEKELPPLVSQEDFAAMANAILDGNAVEGQAKMVEMMQRATQQAVESAVSEAVNQTQSTMARQQQVDALNVKAEELANRYPEFNPESEHVDHGLVEEALELRDVFASRGSSLSEALERAVNIVVKENDLVDRKAAKSEPQREQRDLPERDDSGKFVAKKKSNIAQKIEQAQKEPGRLEGDSGKDVESLSINDMTDEQMDNLSKEALKRMRGDYV